MLAKEFGDLLLHFGTPGTKFNEMSSSLDRIQDRSRDSAGDRLRLGDGHAFVRSAMHDKRRRNDSLKGKIGQCTNLIEVIANA